MPDPTVLHFGGHMISLNPVANSAFMEQPRGPKLMADLAVNLTGRMAHLQDLLMRLMDEQPPGVGTTRWAVDTDLHVDDRTISLCVVVGLGVRVDQQELRRIFEQFLNSATAEVMDVLVDADEAASTTEPTTNETVDRVIGAFGEVVGEVLDSFAGPGTGDRIREAVRTLTDNRSRP